MCPGAPSSDHVSPNSVDSSTLGDISLLIWRLTSASASKGVSLPVNCPHAKRAVNYPERRSDARRCQRWKRDQLFAERTRRSREQSESRGGEAPVEGVIGGTEYPHANRADDFEQAGLLYRVMKEDERTRRVANIAGHLGKADPEIQQRQVQHFAKADREYGKRVASALGLSQTTEP